MVAKAYQTLKKASEPYTKNGKMYIDVETKGGAIKSVRWYSVEEYNKMYPNDRVKAYFDAKRVFGFDKGYITVFKGVKDFDEEWFKKSPCRFATTFGWYLTSTEEMPKDLPAHLKLEWDEVRTDDNQIKPIDEVKKVILQKFYK